MRNYISLSLVVTLVFIIGCSDGSDSTRSDRSDAVALQRLHADPDPTAGGAIVDAFDREVLLRGVNVNAFVEYWSPNDYPTTFPLERGDPELIASFGWNAVRLLVSWSLVEPSPGNYDEAYLDQIEEAVDTLAEHGIYSIIDLHQDAWGATLAAREDENCPANLAPAFGWDGAPAWATYDGNKLRCTAAEIRETSPAVRNAWVAFWDNVPGPDGTGIRTSYARMLGHIAGRFASHAAVAGYDLINEPNAFGESEQAGLAALYQESLEQIRGAEERAGGFAHLVFFEPSILWVTNNSGPPNQFEYDDNVVYAPHVYTGGFSGGPITREVFQTTRDEAVLFGGAPVFSGEWGSDPARADPDGDSYFLDHLRLQDEFHMSSTLWTWRESCGDPHKAAAYRAGQVPVVWGMFDVDCTSNVIRGERANLIDQMTRPLVRAAPGRLDTLAYEPDSGVFSASGDGASAGELVIFYPVVKHGQPTVLNSSGLGEVEEREAPGDNLYLVAQVNGSSWSIELSP